MQSVKSRIWTRVAVFISYDDNNYTTGTSKQKYAEVVYFFDRLIHYRNRMVVVSTNSIHTSSMTSYTLIEVYEKAKPDSLEKFMPTTTISGWQSTYLHQMLSVALQTWRRDNIVRHNFLQALPSTLSPIIKSHPTGFVNEQMPLLIKGNTFVV